MAHSFASSLLIDAETAMIEIPEDRSSITCTFSEKFAASAIIHLESAQGSITSMEVKELEQRASTLDDTPQDQHVKRQVNNAVSPPALAKAQESREKALTPVLDKDGLRTVLADSYYLDPLQECFTPARIWFGQQILDIRNEANQS